jgi:hypothetical protein
MLCCWCSPLVLAAQHVFSDLCHPIRQLASRVAVHLQASYRKRLLCREPCISIGAEFFTTCTCLDSASCPTVHHRTEHAAALVLTGDGHGTHGPPHESSPSRLTDPERTPSTAHLAETVDRAPPYVKNNRAVRRCTHAALRRDIVVDRSPAYVRVRPRAVHAVVQSTSRQRMAMAGLK